MNNDIAKLRLADGCITKMCVDDGDLRVFVRDWRNESKVLIFEDVIGIEAFSVLNADLSHAQESQEDPFLVKSCSIATEQLPAFHCYAFIGPWSEVPILKIVAKSFSMSSSAAAESGGNAGNSPAVN